MNICNTILKYYAVLSSYNDVASLKSQQAQAIAKVELVPFIYVQFMIILIIKHHKTMGSICFLCDEYHQRMPFDCNNQVPSNSPCGPRSLNTERGERFVKHRSHIWVLSHRFLANNHPCFSGSVTFQATVLWFNRFIAWYFVMFLLVLQIILLYFGWWGGFLRNRILQNWFLYLWKIAQFCIIFIF